MHYSANVLRWEIILVGLAACTCIFHAEYRMDPWYVLPVQVWSLRMV
jgi:hypothetical protein